MQRNILITGATGMVGAALSHALKAKGANVSVLSRDPAKVKGFKAYQWDVFKQQIEERCMDGIDTIVHLAGEPIADKRWTAKRKQQITDSRVLSTLLLHKAIKSSGQMVRHFIASSAIGYYGDRGETLLTETAAHGSGFVADCCVQWEAAADKGLDLGLRLVKIRTGIVLAKDEGSLPLMAKPVKLFAGAPLGNGRQWMSWIHHEDITGIYLKAIFDETMQGTYNGCAPAPVTNKTITRQLAKVLHRPVWPFNVPKIMLDLILGQRSVLPLMSDKVSAQKIIDTGYRFKYNKIEEVLSEIYG